MKCPVLLKLTDEDLVLRLDVIQLLTGESYEEILKLCVKQGFAAFRDKLSTL